MILPRVARAACLEDSGRKEMWGRAIAEAGRGEWGFGQGGGESTTYTLCMYYIR
jgi:hypothetical protein